MIEDVQQDESSPPHHHHLDRRHGGSQPKVNLADRSPFIAKFGSNMKELMLPDDPFRYMSEQSCCEATWSLVKYFVPILEWAPKYNLAKLRFDLLAGITVASLSVPQSISYARLAQLPPIVGLYSSFVPPLVYTIFGSSNNVAVGTMSASSILLASIIGSDVSPFDQPELYLHLCYTAALLTGIFETALGIFRLGIVIEFLSRSTITGFMGGAATVVILQQLKGFLGMTHFTNKTDFISVLRATFIYRNEWRWESAVLGICLFSFLLLTKHLGKKFPKLFWLPALAPLAVVIFGCVFTYFIDAEVHGIQIVGTLKKGINPTSVKQFTFDSKYLSVVLKAALLTGFLALSEGIAVGKSLALFKNERTDGNKEMMAFGLMNIVGSCFSCYITSGPFSKSAVNFHAGCKTPISNVVMSICIMLVLLFLAPLFKYTPLVALSAIIGVAMVGLIEYKEAYHLLKVDKFDFVICMAGYICVTFFSMSVGLIVSVALSIVRALLHVARPTTCKLGNVTGTEIYRDMGQYPDLLVHPGILILNLGSPLYYASAGYIRERVSRWVEDEEIITKKNGEGLQYLILDLGGVTSIDNSGIGMLLETEKSLKKKGIKIVLTNPRSNVVEKLMVSEYIDRIGKEWVFLSIKEAVEACCISLQESGHHRDLNS